MEKKKVFYLDPDERKWTMEDLGLTWENIEYQTLKNNMLEGTFFLSKGKVLSEDELEESCLICLEPLDYNEDFDSEYCASCDEWRDDTCPDENCEYCRTRPEKPSKCK